MKNYEGFYKVDEEQHLSFANAILFNPNTNEIKSVRISDADDDWCYLFNKELYHAEINYSLQKKYYAHIGFIEIGDLVKIVSGRKMKGEVKKIVSEYIYHIDGLKGEYGDVYYYVFDDGTKVQQHHCRLFKKEEI